MGFISRRFLKAFVGICVCSGQFWELFCLVGIMSALRVLPVVLNEQSVDNCTQNSSNVRPENRDVEPVVSKSRVKEENICLF